MRDMGSVRASVLVVLAAAGTLAGCASKRTASSVPTPPSAAAETEGASVSAMQSSNGEGEPATTPDEQRETMDRKLETSLAEFDAMLLKEQQEVAARRAEHGTGAGSGSGGAAGAEGEGGEGGPGGSSGGAAGSAQSGGAQTADARAGAQNRGGGRSGGGKDQSTGSSQSGSRGGGGRDAESAPEGSATAGDQSRVPEDVGDGRNDDVVARQLREAAMSEEDPAIREKLWEEYRRYKRGGS